MLKVYNTLTGKKERFVPLEEGKVKIYVCGLTVQNYSHVGHIRSAINYDVIRRYLEYKGFDVTYVQNFTDINEKIVKRAEEEGLTPRELAAKYTEAYLEDIDRLRVKRADIFCTATDHIEEMQELTRTLIDKGYAYQAGGNVYFSVEKFGDYGKLSGQQPEKMESGSRVAVSKDKKHPLDFALWKSVEDEDISWDSPWGKGWPGWHIECSAMSMKYLGDSFDIHGGGTDLIFPHHENEIAQSEASSGKKPFVKYWLHNGTVDIKGTKMSKSLGNFYTTRELLEDFDPLVLRYYILTKHYHSPIEFSREELDRSGRSFGRLIKTKERLSNLLQSGADRNNTELAGETVDYTGEDQNFKELLADKKREFMEAMDDDFNTARSIGVIHELVTEVNKYTNRPEFKLDGTGIRLLKEADELFGGLLEILGLCPDIEERGKEDFTLFRQVVDYLLAIREEARADRNYEFADKIRDDLEDMGIEVKDTPQGVRWNIKGEDPYGG